MLIWGTILLIGAASGSDSLTRPLEQAATGFSNDASAAAKEKYGFPFELVRTIDEFDKKREEAVRNDKYFIAYFYSDTCPVCKKLKKTTLKDQKVRRMLAEEYVAVRVNITDRHNKESMAIKKHYKVFGTPSFIFFDRSGKEMKEENFYGYQSPEEFLDKLDLIVG